MSENAIFLFMQFECIKIYAYKCKLNRDRDYLFMATLNMQNYFIGWHKVMEKFHFPVFTSE
ncbi:hypothetical protein DA391_18210 [Yersinia massiliensis]|uniref:Uncharacterized protein n=1 Tax=Yersinia massiliensis TaxID=419257 RepID=A0ABM6UWJ4_9GAMM|nr:hypothetical protein CRN74_00465 [Yersinia frederiksenii]AVX39428.1 hypothetical protein DA391_18210 [Yersinia massiliensis]